MAKLYIVDKNFLKTDSFPKNARRLGSHCHVFTRESNLENTISTSNVFNKVTVSTALSKLLWLKNIIIRYNITMYFFLHNK
jgi:hypothetical protein